MIVSMKKIHVVVQKKDIIPALEKLRDLGSVHVEHQDALTGYQLTERREEVNILNRAIGILRQAKVKSEQVEVKDWTEVVNATLELSIEVEHYMETMAKRQIQIIKWTPWGDFNLSDLKELKSKGIHVELCQRVIKEKVEAPQGVVLKGIYVADGIERCVAISRASIELPFDTVALPGISLADMRVLQDKERNKIEEAQAKIEHNVCYLESLQKTLKQRESVLEFEEVEKGMKEDDDLVVLKGFCPADACGDLECKSRLERWALLMEEPTEEDQVPTLLKNPKWVNLCKPALNIIEILPGYREFDVSMMFFLFFTIFFAMLIGDGMYAMIFAGITGFVHVKFGNKMPDKTPLYLMYILTGFTFLWGVFTGTFFGQEWLPSYINPVVPWLNDFTNMKLLCFIIALVHLSLARIWAAIARFPSITFLREIGWLLIIWGMFSVANMFVLGMPFPGFAKYFFYVGIPLAFFFMVEPKQFKKVVWQEIVPFVLGVIGVGTDLVSYIRLFAVGVATIAVADATNTIASSLPFVFGVVVLLIGHGLNLVLALMAILVHAIRLNVLEFSGQLGLEWSGFKYKPFIKKIATR